MEKLKVILSEHNGFDFMWQINRFKSFKKWPYKNDSICTPTNMAEAGWYCTSSDIDDPSAKCPFCFKELNGWEPTDNPWSEHVKHSSACLFVKLGKAESCMNTHELYELLQARILKVLELQYQEDLKTLEEAKDKVLKQVLEKEIDNTSQNDSEENEN